MKTPTDNGFITRQLGSLISQGKTPAQALEELKEKTSKIYGSDVEKVLSEYQNTSKLGTAMAAAPGIFSPELAHMVEQLETQDIDYRHLLKNYQHHMDRSETSLRLLKNTTFGFNIYFALLVTVMFIVFSIMIVFVIPQYSALFQSFGADMPSLTRMILLLGEYPLTTIIVMLALIAAGLWVLRPMYRANGGEFSPGDLYHRIPLFGKLVKNYVSNRMLHMALLLLESGVPQEQALSISNAIGKRQLPAGDSDTAGGIYGAMTTEQLNISQGLQTFKDELAYQIQLHDDSLEKQAIIASRSLGLIIYLILGAAVAAFVFGMYLPIFKMGAVV